MARATNEQRATEAWAETVRGWARQAAGFGVNYSEVNAILARVGVRPVSNGDGRIVARYKVTQYNQLRINHTDRDDALSELRDYVQRNNNSGYTCYSSELRGHDVDPATVEFEWRRGGDWVSTDEFFGTSEAEQVEVPATLAEKKELLRTLTVDFYRVHAEKFCLTGARQAFREMEIGELPRRVTRTVQVPVTQATVEVDLSVLEGDDEAQILAAAQRELEARQRRREIGFVPTGTPIGFGEPVLVTA